MPNLQSEAELSGGPLGPTEVTPAGVVAGTVIEILLVAIALGFAACAALSGSPSDAGCCAEVGIVQASLPW